MIDSAALHSKLKEFFGYDTFKGDQESIINHISNSWGKIFCF